MLMVYKEFSLNRLFCFNFSEGKLFGTLDKYKLYTLKTSFFTFTYLPLVTAEYFVSIGFQSQFERNSENPDWFNFKIATNFVNIDKVENEIYSKLRVEFHEEYKNYIDENLRLTKQAKEDRITIDTLRKAIKIVQNYETLSKGEQ